MPQRFAPQLTGARETIGCGGGHIDSSDVIAEITTGRGGDQRLVIRRAHLTQLPADGTANAVQETVLVEEAAGITAKITSFHPPLSQNAALLQRLLQANAVTHWAVTGPLLRQHDDLLQAVLTQIRACTEELAKLERCWAFRMICLLGEVTESNPSPPMGSLNG